MKVFLSWSGPRSKHLADALRTWMPRVLQSLRPWMSNEDISAGSRWLPEIAGELSQAKVGILCVTPENQFSPWLVFEAGALSRTIEQPFVCPLIFDMSTAQLDGPLAQFQALTFDKTGVRRAVQNLNEALGNERLGESDLEEIFEVWWPKLEVRLLDTPKRSEPAAPPRTTDSLLEEILALNREQLRRENLRLEHSQARDERLDQFLPLMEQMTNFAKGLQERGRLLVGSLGQVPIPLEMKQALSSEFPSGKLDEMMQLMKDQSALTRMERQQLLAPQAGTPPEPPAKA